MSCGGLVAGALQSRASFSGNHKPILSAVFDEKVGGALRMLGEGRFPLFLNNMLQRYGSSLYRIVLHMQGMHLKTPLSRPSPEEIWPVWSVGPPHVRAVKNDNELSRTDHKKSILQLFCPVRNVYSFPLVTFLDRVIMLSSTPSGRLAVSSLLGSRLKYG